MSKEFKPLTHAQFIEFVKKQIQHDYYWGELGYFTFGFIENLNKLYSNNQNQNE